LAIEHTATRLANSLPSEINKLKTLKSGDEPQLVGDKKQKGLQIFQSLLYFGAQGFPNSWYGTICPFEMAGGL
jgi:hypothetical protein